MSSTMPMSFLASCTQLQFLKLQGYKLTGPSSLGLAASTMLQHLDLYRCSIAAADGPAEPVSWQQVGPHWSPHLTYLQLWSEVPKLQQADVEAVLACCSNLKVLGLERLQSRLILALARLPGLTNLQLQHANNEQCSVLVQLTGLRQLVVMNPAEISAVGLRQLAALQQLSSAGFGEFYHSKLRPLAKHLMKDNLPPCSCALINKAPCGHPPDVSSRMLDICDVVDACEGLSIEAVVAGAERELEPPGASSKCIPKSPTAQALLAAAAALKAQGNR